jgi:hypothetical protein
MFGVGCSAFASTLTSDPPRLGGDGFAAANNLLAEEKALVENLR